MRDSGLSVQDWGQTFELSPEERMQVGRYAESLLREPKFQRILNEMEYNAVAHWHRTSVTDEDQQREARLLLFGAQSLRRALNALVESKKLAESQAEN